jgi:hypothetical protein
MPVKLCVGAASKRIVEEAANLQVHQIVASRRQVDIGGGYIGWDQKELVDVVLQRSGGRTDVIRDHGGPLQGGKEDDGIESFDADVAAGFDGLHLDVCYLPRSEQPITLINLINRYASRVQVEIGGERDDQGWLTELVQAVMVTANAVPTYAVIEVGGHAWADRQCGMLHAPEFVGITTSFLNHLGIMSKAHNMDWVGNKSRYTTYLDAINIAPEFGCVEIDAILMTLTMHDAEELLEKGYASHAWERWFHDDEGTYLERAKCGIRYIIHDLGLVLNIHQEDFVRNAISESIMKGTE